MKKIKEQTQNKVWKI